MGYLNEHEIYYRFSESYLGIIDGADMKYIIELNDQQFHATKKALSKRIDTLYREIQNRPKSKQNDQKKIDIREIKEIRNLLRKFEG